MMMDGWFGGGWREEEGAEDYYTIQSKILFNTVPWILMTKINFFSIFIYKPYIIKKNNKISNVSFFSKIEYLD